MRLTKLTIAAAGLCCALLGCDGGTVELGEVRPIDSPAGPAGQTPNLAVGLDGELYLSWVEAREQGHALRFARREGDGWSSPRTIAEGDDWFVNWADFPSMAALEDGTLAAHWLVRSGGPTYAYDVVLALSGDKGVTWSPPFRPHRDGTQTEHGFVSLVPRSDGTFGVLWLDGRHMASTPPGPMTLRYATLGADGTLIEDVVVDERVCDCCSTDAWRTDDGALLAIYRDRTGSEIRDISISRRVDEAWSDPRRVHADDWEIPACPVNGPAIDGRGDRVAVAWFTVDRNADVVKVAFSRNGGRTFGRPVRVDDGHPLGRVDLVALDDGSALASWLERDGDRARIVVRRVEPTGAHEPVTVTATSPARSSGFPRMVRYGEQVVLAWTEVDEPSRIAMATLALERR